VGVRVSVVVDVSDTVGEGLRVTDDVLDGDAELDGDALGVRDVVGDADWALRARAARRWTWRGGGGRRGG